MTGVKRGCFMSVKEESAGTRLNFATIILTLTWTINEPSLVQDNKIDSNSVKVGMKLNSNNAKCLSWTARAKPSPAVKTVKQKQTTSIIFRPVSQRTAVEIHADIRKRKVMAGASFISPANIYKARHYQCKDQIICLLESGPVCIVVLMWDFEAYHTKKRGQTPFRPSALERFLCPDGISILWLHWFSRVSIFLNKVKITVLTIRKFVVNRWSCQYKMLVETVLQ